jgi:DNA invertase Pin-like site-specific DNA recombinase
MTAYQVRPRTALPCGRCLKKLEPGDTLIVWKLDRLGRSLRDLITMLDELKRRKVKFRSLTEHIDTDTPMGPRHVADDRPPGRV